MSFYGIENFRPNNYRPTEGGGPTNPPRGGSGCPETTGDLRRSGEIRRLYRSWKDVPRFPSPPPLRDTGRPGGRRRRRLNADGSLPSLFALPVYVLVYLATLGRFGRPLFAPDAEPDGLTVVRDHRPPSEPASNR